MQGAPLSQLFAVTATKRGLWLIAVATLLCGLAMLPAIQTMADHGASVIAFESAGSVSRGQEIVTEWGATGKSAMWWQLGLDTPFLIGYGLFLASACAAVGRRAHGSGKARLERAAAVVVWFGALAAAADFLQNISLALVLGGHVTQPWPRISAISATVTTTLALAAALFALVGAFATRRRGSVEPARSGEAQ